MSAAAVLLSQSDELCLDPSPISQAAVMTVQWRTRLSSSYITHCCRQSCAKLLHRRRSRPWQPGWRMACQALGRPRSCLTIQPPTPASPKTSC